MHQITLLFIFVVLLATLALSETAAATWWQTKDMFHCGGNLHDRIKFDGDKSIVDIPGDGKVYNMFHCIRFCDFSNADFVLEFGEVSPWIQWELKAHVFSNRPDRRLLLSGQGGGTHRVSMSKLGVSGLSGMDMHLEVRADKPGTMEVKRWAIETPKVRFTKEHAAASRKLKGATPMERGHIPHWNPVIGGFVCAYNTTHPEHYNYWLEDEGENLFSFGNYPRMMKLYGKPLRDFIVKYTKHGAPVRRVNDQPLAADMFTEEGKYHIDTGLIVVSGDLAKEPFVDVRHSTYEIHGLLVALGGFHITYKNSDGTVGRLDFDQPSSYKVEYHKPKKDMARLSVASSDSNVSGVVNIDIFRGRLTVSANVSNKSKGSLKDVAAGFELRNCEHYFKSPLNQIREFKDVTLLYSKQTMLDQCNIVRLAGPAANRLEVERNGRNIKRASASAVISSQLARGAKASLKLSDINAGATSYENKIDNYKDADFAEADISLSYVPTYALLGLATYCYRFPEDTEAREAADMMMDNFLLARERLNNRDLGYFIWILDVMGRTKEANEVADLIEKRAEGEKSFGGLDCAGMGIGLRRIGRWEAADRITAKVDKLWDFGVVPASDFLGFGALQSPALEEMAYKQLSHNLTTMYWDAPDKLMAHTNRFVEEGPAETQAYTLVGFDIISRLYGGIVPIRLNRFVMTYITKMTFDESSGEWSVSMTSADEIDILTHFRAPKRITWNGSDLDKKNWKYSKDTGVIYITGLSGEGELVLTVDGPAPKGDPDWEPIDYLGLNRERM